MFFIKFFIKCVNAMKYLEIIPGVLTMYGVFTSQSTSQVRQEMSNAWYRIWAIPMAPCKKINTFSKKTRQSGGV